MARKRKPSRVSEVDQIRSTSKSPVKFKKHKITGYLPTGCTLLNLAMTDHIDGGWPLGNISTLPGVSSAGKTLIALSSLAMASSLPAFDDYRLIFDDVERRQSFDVEYLFGHALAERIEPPPLDTSRTVQLFKHNALTLCDSEDPFIYILDSFDAMTSDEELEKDMRKALAAAKSDEAVKKIAGSFNMEKAKIGGQVLRQIASSMSNSKSALLIIQQLRQNTKARTPFDKKWVTSGGEAPFFYSHARPLLKKIKTHKKTVRGVARPSGVRTRADFEKNSITGKCWPVEFDIFYDLGVDDVGANIDFLLQEKVWSKAEGKINAKHFRQKLKRETLIRYIENNDKERKLQRLVQKAWTQVVEDMKLGRKRRF